MNGRRFALALLGAFGITVVFGVFSRATGWNADYFSGWYSATAFLLIWRPSWLP